MTRRALLGLALLAALVPSASAAPIELRHDRGATAVALAGPDVIVLSETTHGARVVAVPRTGGPARTLLDIKRTGPVDAPDLLAASDQRVVAAIPTKVRDWTIYSGPPSGPLAPILRTTTPRDAAWPPIHLDVDGDRLLLIETTAMSEYRARLHTPSTGFTPPIAWDEGRMPLAIAGPYAASFRMSTQTNELVDLATGTTLATLKGRSGDGPNEAVASDGRIAVPATAGILTATPGTPPRLLPRSRGLTSPRFFGTTIAAMDERGGPLSLLAPDGTRTTLGPPSSLQTDIAADTQGVAWIYNGCVRHSSGPPTTKTVCPPTEIALPFAGSARLDGRSVRRPVHCVHTRTTCRGTLAARTEGGRTVARTRFTIANHRRRNVTLRLSTRLAARLKAKGGTLILAAKVVNGTVGAGRYAELNFSSP